MVDAAGNPINAVAQGAYPDARARPAAGRLARRRRRRPARRADDLARGRVQRVLDAVHDGLLDEVPAQGSAARAGLGGTHRDDGHGADRAGVDPGHPGRARAVRLPAGRAGLSRAADLRGLLLRRVQQAAERQGLPVGVDGGLRARRVPAGGRHAGDAEDGRLRERLPGGLVLLDREPHLLPVLQPAHHDRLDRDDVRGELRDASRRRRRSSSASPTRP